MQRLRIKIVGESGSGLLSTGDIITEALQNLGFYIVSDREFPSLIKGGHSCYTLNISSEKISGLSEFGDVMISLDKQGLEKFKHQLKPEGHLIHGYERLKSIDKLLKEDNFTIHHVMGRTLATELGGNSQMVNVILIGMLWKLLGLDYSIIEEQVVKRFKHKPKLLEIDLKCLKAGFEHEEPQLKLELPKNKVERIVLNGNKALTLGAIHAGCRNYYAYPMSPASSILTYMAEYAEQTNVLVKQAEDEITAAQMCLGSMYMGSRAFTATSGGGYDLMTETVSVAGIIENPLVIVVVQRPGPGTGLPTWTGQGDLNLALHSAHGEFPRIVISTSEPEDSFDLIQHAFNLAEKFQTPVIVLSEKFVAESLVSVEEFKQNQIPIERGLSHKTDQKSEDRYAYTESGISDRWLPCSNEAHYFANGDEHLPNGAVTEDAIPAKEIMDKRMRKIQSILAELPEPQIYGEKANADISFVGWGGSKNAMLDIIQIYAKKGIKVNYLHYAYVYPLQTKTLLEFFQNNSNIHLIEGNKTGQLGKLIQSETNLEFDNLLLKYNGRQFYLEDIQEYIDSQLKK